MTQQQSTLPSLENLPVENFYRWPWKHCRSFHWIHAVWILSTGVVREKYFFYSHKRKERQRSHDKHATGRHFGWLTKGPWTFQTMYIFYTLMSTQVTHLIEKDVNKKYHIFYNFKFLFLFFYLKIIDLTSQLLSFKLG